VTGQLVASYEYDAFGREVRAWGLNTPATNQPPGLPASRPWADHLPFHYSSKLRDVDSGFNYYGYRFYDPGAGRWLNRDPIGEEGGVNLYGMVGNDAANSYDVLGLADMDCEWTLVLGHLSDIGLSVLDEWLGSQPKKGYPGSDCGNHKIGFSTCGPKWINGQIPRNNQLPFDGPEEDVETYDDEHWKRFNDQYDKYKHLDSKNKPTRENLHSAGGSLTEANRQIDSALESMKNQCDNPKNCCKSIKLTLRYTEKTARDWKRDIEIVGQNAHFKNPADRKESVKCEK
jgi:RHS repeat-associated protein